MGIPWCPKKGSEMKEAPVHEIDYGNWVSTRIIFAPTAVAVVSGALSFLSLFLHISAVLLLLVAIYFAFARYLFSARGMNVQETIHSFVLGRLQWRWKRTGLGSRMRECSVSYRRGKEVPLLKGRRHGLLGRELGVLAKGVRGLPKSCWQGMRLHQEPAHSSLGGVNDSRNRFCALGASIPTDQP